MTTQTPTSEHGAQVLNAGGSPFDVDALARLAGEFFAALPGEAPSLLPSSLLPSSLLPSSLPFTRPSVGSSVQSSQSAVQPSSLASASAFAGGPVSALGGVPAPVNVLPGGASLGPFANGPQLPGTLVPGANAVPQSPQSVLSLGASSPSLLPHAAAPNGAPDTLVLAAPAIDSRSGGQVLGVPQAADAAPARTGQPSVVGLSSQELGGEPRPGLSSPYYFVGADGGYPTTLQDFDAPREDRVRAQSFGLPGADDLRILLGDNPRLHTQPTSGRSATGSTSTSALPPSSHASPGYYFAQPERQPHGFGERAPHATAQERNAWKGHAPFDVQVVRRDFPILQERVNGKPLAWFDNAATTHKPQSVIDRIAYFYAHENSNIHRAAHALAARATDAYEAAREKVRAFLGAATTEEIVFVRGATEAINLVAKTWGAQNVGEGDEIVVSHLEHHANIVPWQQLAAAKGAKIRVIPVDDDGQVLLDEYCKLLNPRTRIVAVTQVSNALGTVTPVREIVALAHAAGAVALVDGAQSVSHMRVNVQTLGADFFVFSGHKVFGPTGIGVVYGRRALLDAMPPWQGGGNMIADVTFERTLFQPPPNKFEAGTGNIADAVGLGAAIDYVQRIGLEAIAQYEHDLLGYATHLLRPIPGVRLIGTAREKASVLSFVLRGHTTEEVGQALNAEGIAVRTGHHCAQPILRRFGVEATVRPSLAFYNTCEEVDRFIAVVRRLAQRA